MVTIATKTETKKKEEKPLTDAQAIEAITRIITVLETREDQNAYIFSIAKLRGCIEKMPRTKQIKKEE